MMPKQLPFYRFSTTIKKNLTFSQYLKWCTENNLVADEAFQANSVFKNSTGGTGRWPKNVAQEYLLNLLHGKAPSVFTFANNYECYKVAKEEQRPHDIAYFKKWGKTMMVLDSWNRNETFGITDYDIEIAETHHKHKKDAPSGTALSLGEYAAEGRKTKLNKSKVLDRTKKLTSRKKGDIGFSVTRGGEIAGEHTVSFIGTNDRVDLVHKANNRSIFVDGAIEAAIFISKKKTGLFNMNDLLF